jgi:hypothetical protein
MRRKVNRPESVATRDGPAWTAERRSVSRPQPAGAPAPLACSTEPPGRQDLLMNAAAGHPPNPAAPSAVPQALPPSILFPSGVANARQVGRQLDQIEASKRDVSCHGIRLEPWRFSRRDLRPSEGACCCRPCQRVQHGFRSFRARCFPLPTQAENERGSRSGRNPWRARSLSVEMPP